MAEPYRDELSVIAEKLRQVEEELDHIASAAARRDELEREAAELKKRLKAVQAARARGPLDDLRIASPCNQSWEQMVGDERVRHCGGCKKDVYNVSGMTRAEAVELLKDRAGQELCLRMYRRADGTVLTADCPVGAKRKRVRRLVMVGAGVAAGTAGALWAWSDGTRTGSVAVTDIDLESQRVTMGEPADPGYVTGEPTSAATQTIGSASLPPSPPPPSVSGKSFR